MRTMVLRACVGHSLSHLDETKNVSSFRHPYRRVDMFPQNKKRGKRGGAAIELFF